MCVFGEKLPLIVSINISKIHLLLDILELASRFASRLANRRKVAQTNPKRDKSSAAAAASQQTVCLIGGATLGSTYFAALAALAIIQKQVQMSARCQARAWHKGSARQLACRVCLRSTLSQMIIIIIARRVLPKVSSVNLSPPRDFARRRRRLRERRTCAFRART